MKHNKKRNTAFLYEALIKEMTRAAIKSDSDSKRVVGLILKEHFGADNVLGKELNLYKTICEVHSVQKQTAEKILNEVKRVYHTLSEEDIFDEQSKVIKKINTDLSKNVFNNFISNYKTLATISQMFNGKTPISKRVILEEKVVEIMSSPAENAPALRPIDNITYNVFVQKFNEKYGSTLNESQKYLLSRYITLSPENAVEFKIYVSDELSRLKESISKLSSSRDIILDEGLSSKTKEISALLESFKKQPINDDMIKKILKIQALAVEV